MRKTLTLALLAILVAGALQAQNEGDSSPKPGFKAGVALGTDILPTGPNDENGNPTNEGWTRLGFQPDIAFGKLGIGLDLTARIQLYKTQDQAVTFYEGDWIPGTYAGQDKTLLDIYLPKFLYIRYGLKGADPLFAKLGSIDDLTLGAGFIMGNYSNMKFMPETRLFGLDFGIDGAMFNFPYLGLELVTGNLARFDVVGGRLYSRPLQFTGLPIVKDIQVGLTTVMDTDPGLYGGAAPDGSVSVFGGDVMAPILANPVLSMAAFSELAFEPNGRTGFMLGVGGKLISLFTWGAQLRVLGPEFIPVYFDANYDLYRAAKASFVANAPAEGAEGVAGWYASLGTSLLDQKVVLNAALDGPFGAADPAADLDNQARWPHLRAVFILGEDLLGGIYADASYEKYYLGKNEGFFQDLIDPADAIIGLNLNYKTGGSVLTIRYDVRYDPVSGEFRTSSSIQAGLKL